MIEVRTPQDMQSALVYLTDALKLGEHVEEAVKHVDEDDGATVTMLCLADGSGLLVTVKKVAIGR